MPRNISCKDQHNKGKKWQGPSRSRKNEKEIVRTHRRNGLDSDDVIIHLEPDILECEVKWVLGSITMNKASGGDGIPVELFQTLKDDAVKVLQPICHQPLKTQWPLDRRKSVFIPIPKKGNSKEYSNYRTIALVSHISKVMHKILKARLQQYMNQELPDIQAEFRKGRVIRNQIATSFGSQKKEENFRNTSISASMTMLKILTMWITINCRNV